MLYCPVYPDQRGPVNTTAQISGRNLAHGHRSKAERVLTAADLIDGRLVLIKPTATQTAKLLTSPSPTCSPRQRLRGVLKGGARCWLARSLFIGSRMAKALPIVSGEPLEVNGSSQLTSWVRN